ncbi:hypothetical protein [Desulfobulbus elongatus]|uniref:hypothetical protein n=1 Tax=Desulfobulbus elongatus TaxID=53332 RepID=UPI0012F7C084|nr:hypothetical protein [Desulfobulbus elongatus]
MKITEKHAIIDAIYELGDTYKSKIILRRIDKIILYCSALMLAFAALAAAGYQDHISSHADAITIICLFFWAMRFFETKTKKISGRWFD